MLNNKLFKFTFVLTIVVMFSSCSNELVSPALINKLDSYCGDFNFATESIDDAYIVYLTTFDPWYNTEIQGIPLPLAECLKTVNVEKIRGPEKYYSSPDDMIVWLRCYYDKQDDYPVKVQYCLLDDLMTIVIVANNENGHMSPSWFRACWYSISKEQGECILEAANETMARALDSLSECSSEDFTDDTSQDTMDRVSDLLETEEPL